MGWIYGSLLFVVGMFVSYPASSEVVPWSCLNIEGEDNSIREERCKILPPNYAKNKKVTYSNVCMFHVGEWGIGKLRYDASTNTYAFIPRKTCEKGITALNIDFPGLIKGPRAPDSLSATSQIKYDPSNMSYISTSGSGLSSTERPVKCAVNGNIVNSTTELKCDQMPNNAGYCRFVFVNQPNYKGYWWVRYEDVNQTRPKVCAHGVRVKDFQEEANANNQRYTLTSYTSRTLTNYVTTYSSQLDNYVRQSTSACYSMVPNTTNMIRNSCSGHQANVAASSTVAVTKGQCVFLKSPTLGWQMYYMTDSGTDILTTANRLCTKIEDLNYTVIEPSTLNDSST